MSGGERAGVETMTVKVGDRIWVSDTVSDVPDPKYAAGCVMTQEPGQNECMVFEDAWIPDHPALPAVARWLSETPNAVDRLWHVLDIYGNSAHAEVDAEQVLSSLLAALTGGGD